MKFAIAAPARSRWFVRPAVTAAAAAVAAAAVSAVVRPGVAARENRVDCTTTTGRRHRCLTDAEWNFFIVLFNSPLVAISPTATRRTHCTAYIIIINMFEHSCNANE